MARVLKILAGLIVSVLVLAVVAVFVITNTNWGHEQLRTRLVSILNGVAHGKVGIERIDGDLLKGITLSGVTITDSAGAPFVNAKQVHVAYDPFSFISRKIDLNDVRFVEPVIVLNRQLDGRWNFDRIFPVDTTGPKKQKTGVEFGDWLVFHKVQLINGNLTVRMPWKPSDTLAVAQRDSVIKAALDSTSRTVVVRVPGGFQQVQEFRAIDGRLPLVRIAQPEFTTRLIEVDSLRMTAFAFAPPPVEVRQLAGKFELNTDSVWFNLPNLQLPASSAQLVGRYTITNGDLALRTIGNPVALADVRFILPALPSDGVAKLDLALVWAGKTQQYVVHNLDLKTGTATVTGDIGVTLGDTIRLHETNVQFAGLDTKLIQQIVPALESPRRGILSGRAKVEGALTSMQLDGDLTFSDKLSGVSRVMAVGEIGTGNGVFRTRDLRVRLSPAQVDLVRISVKDFPLHGTITGSATLNGATNTGLNFSAVDLTHLEDGERSRFTGQGQFKQGDVPFFALDAMAQPLSLVTVGRFAPAAGLRSSVTGPIKLNGTTRDLAVSATLQSADSGIISATGHLDLASKEIGYDLNAFTKLFNASVLAEKAPRTSLSAKATAKGRGFEPATMTADVDASLSTSTIDTLAVDSSRVRVRIAQGIAVVDTFVVNVPGAKAEVKGQFGMSKEASGTLTYHAQVDSMARLARYIPRDTSTVVPRPGPTFEKLEALRADSEKVAKRLMVARAAGVVPAAPPISIDTPPAFHRDTLAGTVTADGSLTGSIASFNLQGTATGKGIIAVGNSIERAKLKYTWNGVMGDSALADVAASADSVSASGFALDSVAAHVTYTKPGGKARVAIFQNSQRDYSLTTAYAIFPDRQEVHFDSLRFRFDTTRWSSVHPGGISWGNPGIQIDTLELRNNTGGRIMANGKVPTDATADLKVVIEKFQLGDLVGLLQSDLALRGLFSADAQITGTGVAPLIAAKASIVDGTYGGTDIPELNTTFNYVAQKLATTATATYADREVLNAKGTVPINLATSGVTESRLVDGDINVDVKLDSLPIDLAARFTDAVNDVRGYAKGSATVRGPIKKPKIEGDLIVADARVGVTQVGIVLDTLNGSVHVHGDSVTLDSLTAHSRGRINITGGMGIVKLTEPSFDFKVSIDNAQLLNTTELGKVRANANFTIKGPFDGVVVNGSARIREGVLYIPKADTRETINEGDSVVFAAGDTTNGREVFVAKAPSPLMSNIQMNLTLAVDRDTWVRSKEANVEIYSDGDLRIDVDRRRGQFSLDGVVNTDRGQYTVFSKRFLIKRGSATFVPTSKIDPLLQLTAEYAVQQASQQDLQIRLLIGGTALQPKLTLSSDAQPPISQSDLLSYLAFGSESGSLLQFGGGSSVSGGTAGGGLVGASAALATKQLTGIVLGVAINEIKGQAGRRLGADVFNITPTNIPTELGSSSYAKTLLNGTQLEFGKYFTTATFVGLNLQASTAPGFRIEHRFGLTSGLSLESTLQPRYFLLEPTLAPQDFKKANAFGLFLVRRWKF